MTTSNPTTTIIGTGNMGSAIGGRLEKAGTVQVLRHSDAPTDLTGDIVVLAVPYEALADIATRYGGQLDDRIVVDLTNPVDFDTFDALKVPADSSAAAELQRLVPGARVLKAFNTSFANTLSGGQVGPVPTTVLVAGDDEAAKQALIERLHGAELNGLDAGSLARARELEALGFLQISLANSERISWSAGFAVVTG